MAPEAAIEGIKGFLKQNPSISDIIYYVETEAQKIASKRLKEQAGEKRVH